jgi:hypothetical protein
MIDVVEIPIEEIPSRILNGEITHALMLNTFFFAALKDVNSPVNAKHALVEKLRAFQDPA